MHSFATRLLFCTALILLGCQSELAADLEEGQADEVILALDRAGIGARKKRTPLGRYHVLVAHGDVPEALAVMRDEKLPREQHPNVRELFGDRGLVPSAAAERARHAAALAGELARSIESFEGVERARVHLALPEASLLDAAPQPARASVLVAHRPGATIDEASIRALVAGAVRDLAADDVAVVRTLAPGSPKREPVLVSFGPLSVARSSVTPLRLLLGASFATNLVLASLLLYRYQRRTRSTTEPGR